MGTIPCNRRALRLTRTRRGATGLLLSCTVAALCVTGCRKPVWYLSPDLPERVARKENKPILYYFRAFDSTHHRNMLRNVLWNNRVEEELLDTVNLDLEFGFFEEQQARYDVRKPQVCVLVAPDGTRLTPNHELVPVPSVDAFLTWLKEAKARAPAAAARDAEKSEPPSREVPQRNNAAPTPATGMQPAS